MAQARDGRDLLDIYQPGDRASYQRIIRAYQNEIVRGSFLLTGDAVQAIRLATIVFLDLFRALSRGAATDDPRETLLAAMTRRWLAGDLRSSRWERDAAAGVAATAIGGAADGAQRFEVGTERSRVLQALGRLDQSVRAALVLREFNLLDEETVCRILDTNPFELRQQIQPARAKIQDVAGSSTTQTARDLLIDAATAAPRPDLWAELEAPLEELAREEQERRQRYTYIAAAFVGLALILAATWLFGFFPAGDDDSSAVSAEVGTPTLEPTPTIEPTPTPIPDIASLDLPQADVPGRLLVQSVTAQGRSEAALYDPESNEYLELDAPQLSGISPDGRWLVRRSYDAEGPSQAFSLIDGFSGNRAWETRVMGDGIGSWVMTADTFYALVTLNDELTLVALNVETGEEVNRWTGLIDDLPRVYISRLAVSLDGTRLFILIDETSRELERGMRLIASFGLPEVTLEAINRREVGEGPQPFPADSVSFFSGARVTPDGEYIYGVSSDTVWFRNAWADRRIDLDLPFSLPMNGATDDLLARTSNDGRYLFVVAPARQEAAIVDLLARRLVRAFPIDPGEFADPDGPELLPLNENLPGARLGLSLVDAAISPDGSRLYLTGGWSDADGNISAERSQIWVIDLATWVFVDRWHVSGSPLHIATLGNELHAYVYSPTDDPRFTWRLTVTTFDAATGSVLVEDHQSARPDPTDNFWVTALPELYRATYGRLPLVDGAEMGTVELESTLPRAEIDTSTDTVPVGTSVDIGAGFADPATGEQLSSNDPSVRFDTETTAVMRLRHEDGAGDDIILIPTSDGPGSYHASAVIEHPGFWSVEVTLTAPDGSTRTISNPVAFAGVPSFEATDGERYILRIGTDPAEPVATTEEISVRGEFVELSSGEPLPVTADLLKGAPDEIQILFLRSGHPTATARLNRVEAGHYEGTVSSPASGVWMLHAKFQFGDGEYASIPGGLVRVGRR